MVVVDVVVVDVVVVLVVWPVFVETVAVDDFVVVPPAVVMTDTDGTIRVESGLQMLQVK